MSEENEVKTIATQVIKAVMDAILEELEKVVQDAIETQGDIQGAAPEEFTEKPKKVVEGIIEGYIGCLGDIKQLVKTINLTVK